MGSTRARRFVQSWRGGASYGVLAENPAGAEGQKGIASLRIEAETGFGAELLKIVRQVADGHEDDGLITSFQEPGQEHAELGPGYVAYNEAGRERIVPAVELLGAAVRGRRLRLLRPLGVRSRDEMTRRGRGTPGGHPKAGAWATAQLRI